MLAPAAYVGEYFVDRGYMSNYAAGYHLVRLQPKTSAPTVSNVEYVVAAGGAFKERGDTIGPLTQNLLDKGRVPASSIGILGDGGPGDIDEAILVAAVPNAKVELPQGMLLSEAFNDGPAWYDGTANRLILLNNGASLNAQRNCERGEATTVGCPLPGSTQDDGTETGQTAADNGKFYLQDTRDWFAHHLGTGNILMADGSVKLCYDTNGDSYFNPGFQVSGTLTEEQYARIGYESSEVEMSPDAYFNGTFIDEGYFKGRFEEN